MISVQAETPLDTAAPPALGLLNAAFARLHAERIRYCHWKSNEHLRASMLGLTDLDLLVDPASAVRLPRVLEEQGFKRFQAKPGRGYPGIEDYVGFDAETGRLSHLHVHYQLTLGAPYLKGHRLPWENVLLVGRRFDPENGVFVASPEAEMLILVARAALKIRWRERMANAVGKRYVRGGTQRELTWLSERVDLHGLLALARRLVGDSAARTLQRIAETGTPSLRQLSAFRQECVPSLDCYRIYGRLSGLSRQWVRELRALAERGKRRLVGGLRASPRMAPRGGRVVAIIGADGAGKSTLTGEAGAWLSRQSWVITAYGGSGAGSASTLRRVLERVAALARLVTGSSHKNGGEQAGAGSEGVAELHSREPRLTVKNLWKALWVMALARERRQRVERAWRARTLGAVVLSDRHPQTQFPGISDGPQLIHWRSARSRLLRFAAERERLAFDAMGRYPPDVVIKLLVTAEVALGRKPARSETQLRRKVEMIRKLTYPAGTRVVDIDAELPLEQVLLDVKRTIWESL